jgi:hypothetical protein
MTSAEWRLWLTVVLAGLALAAVFVAVFLLCGWLWLAVALGGFWLACWLDIAWIGARHD